MTTPASTIVIEAEDKASRVIEQTAQNVNQSVSRIKDVSGKAKASTEFIGVLASSLGGSELGSYASQLAGMTEKVSQFAEVSKTGKAGALAFKAGLVGLVGTIAVGVGKAIGDVVFETEKWAQKLSDANKAASDLNSKIQANKVKQFADDLADIKLIPDAEERGAALQEMLRKAGQEADSMRQRLEGAQKKSEEWQDAWFKFGNRAAYAEQAAAEVEAQKEALEVARQNLETIREETGERAKLAAEAERKAEALKAEEALQKSIADKNKARAESAINLEVATIQKIEERRVAIEQGATAARAYALEQQGLTQEVAARLAAEEAALDASQKATEAKTAADEKAKEDAKQLAQIQQDEIDRLEMKRVELLKGADAAKVLALQQRGLSKEFAERLVAEENALDRVQKERDERQEAAKQLAGVQTGVQAVQSRLLTRGPADRGIDRIARAAEKQLAILERGEKRAEANPPQQPQKVTLVQVG